MKIETAYLPIPSYSETRSGDTIAIYKTSFRWIGGEMLFTKERIGIIRLSQKISKNPAYAERIGVEVGRKDIQPGSISNGQEDCSPAARREF